MADKELGIKVTGDISDISTALDQLANMLNSLTDQTVNVDVNVNSDSLSNLNNEITETTSNMGDIGAASELTAQQINEAMSTSASSIDTVSTESMEAATDLYNLGVEGENTGTEIASGMNEAVLAVAALGLGLETVAEDIADVNTSIEKLSTKQELTGIGLDEGQYRGMIADITNAKFPTEDAIKYIRALKTMGTADENLGKSATALNQLAVSTGLSSDQMKTLAMNLNLVGVDMNNVSSSFDAVAYGAAKSKGGIETYNKYMERYAYKLGELGLNADQSAVLIAAASQKYGTSRKGMAEFGKELEKTGGNLSAWEKELGLSNGTLTNAANTTSQFNNVVEVNSQKAQDNATSWQKAAAVYEDIKVQFGDILGAATSFLAVPTILTAAGAGIAKAADKIFPGNDFFKGYIKLFTDAGGKIKDVIKTGWGKLFGDAGSDIGGKLLTKIKDALPKSIDDLLSKIFKGGKGAGVGMVFTKEDIVGQEGSQKRTSWEEVLKGWGLSQADLRKWNDDMNKGPLEDAKANTQALAQFVSGSISSLSGITTPITDTLNWLSESVASWGQTGLAMITSFISGLTGSLPNLDVSLNDFESIIQETIDWLLSLPSKAWQWGWDLIDSWKQGIGAALNGAKEWLEYKLSPLTDLLEGHSPPKEGPLSEIDQWGMNIGRSFIEGIGKGIGLSSTDLTKVLTGISGGFNAAQFSLPAVNNGGLTNTAGSNIPVTINLTLPAMSSREDAVTYGEAAGQAAGKSLAKVLQGQATNAGVSTINMMR